MVTANLEPEDKLRYFGAVCLTETPISEIHCLLEISSRTVDLQPYGLVFLKDQLIKKGMSPVIYINNEQADRDHVVQALCKLIDSDPDAAAEILPLVSVFGHKIHPPRARKRSPGLVDFRWEREWRYPHVRGALRFDENDVFIGLCPHDEIADFEAQFHPVEFIDPCRNMKWYAEKLIAARQRLDLKHSVV
jgi:abortive phage resistance protein AbiGi (putative antitoxin)